VRFLCLCEGGIVRSSALASVLRWEFGQDALAASAEKNAPETIAMLCEWANYVIVMQPRFAGAVPARYAHKVHVLDVGPDVWKNPLHPELLTIVGDAAEKWRDRGWQP
jgi:hypothetical protein